MASGYACQRCSQLPPPPPIFTISPPPNILSIEVRCSSRLLSSSSIETKKSTLSSSSTISIVLGIVIVILITTSTIVLIKKRRQGHKRRKCDDTMMVSSSSVKFNRHHQHNNNHHRQNWTKFLPLLTDSCSSDHTTITPQNEYPCNGGVIEPLLNRDLHHEYEQIKCDDSLHYYCLVYCRQCANYHQTSSSSSSSSSLCPRSSHLRPYYLPLSSNPPSCQHQCVCYHRTYHQRNDNNSEDLNHQLKFIEETSPSI